ncbi:TIGR02285 family protein [Rugamonas aquatica]|uniref:TIGR02285 family protein n=1 Tax=Rugamonas aquatica TaxID=2743357 RepID=A0A6A7N3U3_9BURK|nr:TIGR02285 family protein [Rugamonas aquatica]MQA39518.1 TIGR02285 family protein [Rugamonas aquatica]
MRALLLALSLTLPASAAAQAVMTWLMPDLPPASIRARDQPSAGITDAQIAYVQAHWPEVQHRFVYANLKRTWTMLDAGEPVCYSFTLINAERLKRAHIVETGLLPPLQLVVRAEVAAALPLNANGEVDLPRLLAMPELRGLISEKRSFGTQLDTALRRRPPNSTLKQTVIGSYGENILSKMLLSRADYTIDYDFILAYYKDRNPRLGVLRSFPIAGNAEPIKLGFACPKTDWGKATARKLDELLASKEGARALRNSIDKWISPDARQRYAEQFSAFYRRREKPMLAPGGP